MKGILTIKPLCKAIVEGRKDQTRRVIKTPVDRVLYKGDVGRIVIDTGETLSFPPYKNGERLYLKEPYWDFGYYHKTEKTKAGYPKWVSLLYRITEPILYPYDGEKEPTNLPELRESTVIPFKTNDLQWKKGNKYFMPEKYARSFVDVVIVGVERLQDISETDCINEGIMTYGEDWVHKMFPEYAKEYLLWELTNAECPIEIKPPLGPSPKQRFEKLWDSINKPPYSWHDNPNVFVYGLKLVK